MITWARLGEVREATIRPVELPCIYDSSAHGRAITAEVLRQRIDHQVCTMLDRLEEDRGEGIIYDQGKTMSVGDLRYSLDIYEVELGVA